LSDDAGGGFDVVSLPEVDRLIEASPGIGV
jgi:hypothetical protein